MGAGDCHEVAIKYLIEKEPSDRRIARKTFKDLVDIDKGDIVLVQLERELFTEFWGHHSVILNKRTNKVLDMSIGSRIKKGGGPLIADKETLWKEWNVQEDGDGMYYEYDRFQTLEFTIKEEAYTVFELKRSRWEDEGHTEYMRDYFIPNFQPTTQKLMEESDMKKCVTN